MHTSPTTSADRPTDSPKARVLLFAESPYFGGITSHLLSIVDAFAGHDVFETVVATLPGKREDTALIDAMRARGHHVDILPMSGTFDLRIAGRLRRYLRDQQIDLVHAHNYRTTLVSALARHRLPVVNTFHGMLVGADTKSRFWQWAELRAMRRHAATIACSDFVRTWLIGQGLAQDRVRTVYNACEPGQTARPITRQELGIPEDALLLVYVGRLAEGKGLSDLLAALKQVDDAAIVVVGDGPLRHTLELQARDTGIPARFAGYQPDPTPYYRLADVVALPSAMEALPMTLIEAAAQGKPALATTAGGIPEVVVDGETGLLTPYGDVEALQRALARYRDRALCAALGRNAQARWRSNFAPERMAQGLSEAYAQALGIEDTNA